jgi:hypothetical protein
VISLLIALDGRGKILNATPVKYLFRSGNNQKVFCRRLKLGKTFDGKGDVITEIWIAHLNQVNDDWHPNPYL